VRQGGDVGFAREVSAQSSDGVFDAALLPRGARVAEEGLDAELVGDALMAGELGSIVEGD
jgi:hypothetical protein